MAAVLLRAAFEHPQHAVGHQIPAHDVDRAERHGQESQDGHQVASGVAGHDEGADERDAGDRIGSGHERRVQDRRNLRNDLKADEHRQDEDVQSEEQALGDHPTASSTKSKYHV